MFGLSFGEIFIILVVALMVLGPQGMPKLARTLGKAMRDFRRATGDLKGAFEEEFYKLDQPLEDERPVQPAGAPAADGAVAATLHRPPEEAPAAAAPAAPAQQAAAAGPALAAPPDAPVARGPENAIARGPEGAVARGPENVIARAPEGAIARAPENALARTPAAPASAESTEKQSA